MHPTASRRASSFVSIVIFAFFAILSRPLVSQTDPNIDNSVKPYTSIETTSIDRVNLQNGALWVEIPLFSYPQRGDIDTSVVLMLGSKAWHVWQTACQSSIQAGEIDTCKGSWHPGPLHPGMSAPTNQHFGIFLAIDDGMPVVAQYPMIHSQPGGPGSNADTDPNDNADIAQSVPSGTPRTPTAAGTTETLLSVAYLPDGSQHSLWPSPDGTYQMAVDGSGMRCNGCAREISANMPPITVARRDGAQRSNQSTTLLYSFPNGTYQDRNGNQIDTANTDTMGRSLYQGLNGTSTDLSGCASADTQAQLYNFPAPGQGVGDSSRLLKICSRTIYLTTNFNSTLLDMAGNGIPVTEESRGAQVVITGAIVYDGSSWTTSPHYSFEYNGGNDGTADPNSPAVVNYGDLTKITLPTGGNIAYTWGTLDLSSVDAALETPDSRVITSRTVDPGLGDPSQVQSSTYSFLGGLVANTGLTVTDKLGNYVVHTFKSLLPGNIGIGTDLVETKTQWFDSGNKLWKQVDTEYTASEGAGDLGYVPINIMKTAETVTYEDGTKLRKEFDYDHDLSLGNNNDSYSMSGISLGLISQEREYDVNQASGGAIVRCTSYSYAAWPFGTSTSAAYFAANLLDLKTSEQVFSGSCSGGSLASSTTDAYDETSLSASGVTAPLLTPKGSVRGNHTSTTRASLMGGETSPTTRQTYFDTGEVASALDANLNQTTYAYDLAYQGAYQTTTVQPATNGVRHAVSAAYDVNTGQVTSITDMNGNTSQFSYDVLGRMWTAHFPDAPVGSLSRVLCYPDLTSVRVETAQLAGASAGSNSEACSTPTPGNRVATTTYDGLGRVRQTRLDEGNGSSIYVDTTYDVRGFVFSVSNPYRTLSDPTYALKQTLYDPLGRKSQEINQDGSSSTWSYSGLSTTVQDENGHSRTTSVNALEQLRQVLEASPNGGVAPETDYTYNAVGDLTFITQLGQPGVIQPGTDTAEVPRSRSFTYDGLSRLLTSNNPESGPVCYGHGDGTVNGCQNDGYDPNGNLLYKTDARGKTVSYTYDALNRLTAKSYSDATPPVTFRYDEAGDWGAACGDSGFAQCNAIGRLSSMSTGDGKTGAVFGYDSMGRRNMKATCIDMECANNQYVYQTSSFDLDGSMLSDDVENNGEGTSPYGGYSFTYDGAGRISGATSYHNATQPISIFASTLYGPIGLLNSTLGSVLKEVRSYDVRMRLQSYNAVSPSLISPTWLTGWMDSVQNSDVMRFPGDANINVSGVAQNGSITVSGWAANAASCPVMAVEVDVDGTTIGNATLGLQRSDVDQNVYNSDAEHTNCGYTFTGSVGDLAPGSHTVTAVAQDSAGERLVLGASPTITVSAQAPPFGWVNDPGPVPTTVTAGGLVGIAGFAIDSQMHAPVGAVKILLDGATVLGYATLNLSRPDVVSYYNDPRYQNSGWIFFGSIGNDVSPGTHTITAVVYDAGGQSATLGGSSSTITVVPDPTIVAASLDTAVNPSNQSTSIPAGGTLYASGWAAEFQSSNCAGAISRVDVLVDGHYLGQAQLGFSRPDVVTYFGNSSCLNVGWQYTGSLANVDPGFHQITARAYDEAGGGYPVSTPMRSRLLDRSLRLRWPVPCRHSMRGLWDSTRSAMSPMRTTR